MIYITVSSCSKCPFLRTMPVLHPNLSTTLVSYCTVFLDHSERGKKPIPEEIDINKGKPEWCILKKHELVIQHSSK